MARILSISYDQALLQTRELMLSREGFEVQSAIGFSAAVHAAENGKFDLVIVGHSIPTADQTFIIKQVKARSAASVLALRRPHDGPLEIAEHNLDPDDPERFLAYVKQITNHKQR
jgi:DNA-binding response OmpR family regulator